MKNKYWILCFVYLFPLLLFAQSVEVDGKFKVTVMDTMDMENQLVVKNSNGTFGTRLVSSLPPPPDTTRSLQSDLLLTSALCNCTNLPPAMIQSLLDNGYTALDLLGFQVSIQNLFNVGLTPLDLYNEGIPLDSIYGNIYQGGLIFYLNTSTGGGLVSAPTDQSTGAPWGCSGSAIPGADGTALGTGNQNTTDIMNGCNDPGIAAEICFDLSLNGYDDWFLPSLDELTEMYFNIGQGAPSPKTNVGEFQNSYYWSSSEINSEGAESVFFYDGVSANSSKYVDILEVRAIRAF